MLTAAKIYGSSEEEGASSGRAAAQTFVVRGSNVEIVSTTAAAKTVTRSSGTLNASGTKLIIERTCAYPAAGEAGADAVPYTATASTMVQYSSSGLSTFELTYTKR